MKLNRKAQFIIAVMLLPLVGFYYLFLYDGPYVGLIEDWDGSLVFAHRGFGNYAPDNSMAAVQLAVDNGLDGVDIDGQLTGDGELVIFHDVWVDRLTDGSGRLDELSLEQFQALDLGSAFDEAYAGESPGTFEDALNILDGNGILMVELKTPAIFDNGFAARAGAIIKKYEAYDWVYLSSFNPFVLYRLKKINPSIRTVFIFMDTNWNQEIRNEVPAGELADLPFFLLTEFFRRGIRKLVNPDMLSIQQEVDEQTIKNLLDVGWPIFLWPPDSDDELDAAFRKAPYGIITNEPLKAIQWRENHLPDS